MMHYSTLLNNALLVMGAVCCLAQPARAAGEIPGDVKFSGPASSPISSTVAVPAGRAWFLTSGTPPPVADESASAGSPARFGDTKAQGVGALRQIEARLKEAGLSLKDVVFLRVYVAADKAKEGKFDYRAGSTLTRNSLARQRTPQNRRARRWAWRAW